MMTVSGAGDGDGDTAGAVLIQGGKIGLRRGGVQVTEKRMKRRTDRQTSEMRSEAEKNKDQDKKNRAEATTTTTVILIMNDPRAQKRRGSRAKTRKAS